MRNTPLGLVALSLLCCASGCNWLFGIAPPSPTSDVDAGNSERSSGSVGVGDAASDTRASAPSSSLSALDASNASLSDTSGDASTPDTSGDASASDTSGDVSATDTGSSTQVLETESPTTPTSSDPCAGGERDAAGCVGVCPDDQGCAVETCVGGGCPPKEGQPCGPGLMCGEGTCQPTSDGSLICCTAACSSACQTCSANGSRCVSKVDDPACGTIECPSDTPCREYQKQSVASDRCVNGACGTSEQVCPFTVRGQGQACSPTHLCDASGNCSVAKLKLGAACDEGSQCATEQCVDGVCCESACDGVCSQCRAGTGMCDVTPIDDARCPDVICTRFDAECGGSQDITAERCADLGVCKAEADCPVIAKPKGTPCWNYPRVCDGAGNCSEREVDCGDSSCQTGGANRCCVTSSDALVSAPECRNEADPCLADWSDWALACDEQADCRAGEEICCAVATSGGNWTQCMPAADCNLAAEGTGVSIVELCESPHMIKQACSLGVACAITSDTLPGFTFCRLP